jgi:hypothetical protein
MRISLSTLRKIIRESVLKEETANFRLSKVTADDLNSIFNEEHMDKVEAIVGDDGSVYIKTDGPLSVTAITQLKDAVESVGRYLSEYPVDGHYLVDSPMSPDDARPSGVTNPDDMRDPIPRSPLNRPYRPIR